MERVAGERHACVVCFDPGDYAGINDRRHPDKKAGQEIILHNRTSQCVRVCKRTWRGG